MGVDRGGCVGALGTRDLSVGQVSFGRVHAVSVGQGSAYLLSWTRSVSGS